MEKPTFNPTPQVILERIQVHNCDNLERTLLYLDARIPEDVARPLCYADMFFNIEFDYYDKVDTFYLTFHYNESLSQIEARRKKYDQDLAKYEKWYEKNKDKLEAKKAKNKEKFKKSLQTQKANLEKELAKINKKLKKAV